MLCGVERDVLCAPFHSKGDVLVLVFEVASAATSMHARTENAIDVLLLRQARAEPSLVTMEICTRWSYRRQHVAELTLQLQSVFRSSE